MTHRVTVANPYSEWCGCSGVLRGGFETHDDVLWVRVEFELKDAVFFVNAHGDFRGSTHTPSILMRVADLKYIKT